MSSSSHYLNTLDVHAIRLIASLLPGHRLWKLYACGNGRLNYSLENSVDHIRMYTPIAGVRILNDDDDRDRLSVHSHSLLPTVHPSFWYRFKLVNHIVIGRGVPLPSTTDCDSLFLPNHMLSNLHCLSLSVQSSKTISTWKKLMELGENMHSLSSLTYMKVPNFILSSRSCIERSEDGSTETQTFVLPDSMKQSLLQISVDIRFKYWLSNLPPNLETLSICGALADFEYKRCDSTIFPGGVTSSAVVVSPDAFPASLSSLEFTAVRLREENRLLFKATEFHLALTPGLKFLSMMSHVNPFYAMSELLPRGLKTLCVYNMIGRDHSLISIANLPPKLEVWRGGAQPAVREDTKVALPASLKAISFVHGFSRYRWSNVTYPNPHLRIRDLQTAEYYTNGDDPFFSMIESVLTEITVRNRNLLPLMPNCKSLCINASDDIRADSRADLEMMASYPLSRVILELSVLNLLPSSLTRLKLTSFGDLNAKTEVLNDSSSSPSSFKKCSFFALLPRTLLHLHIITAKHVNDLQLGRCTIDLASHLPNLSSLVIQGKGTNFFQPLSLPQTLRKIAVSGGHRVSFVHILSLLPERVEECELHGDLERENLDTFVPGHIGALSACGVSLELVIYNMRQMGIGCEKLMASIRSRNNHLNMVKFLDCSDSRAPYLTSVLPYVATYYKRVEVE